MGLYGLVRHGFVVMNHQFLGEVGRKNGLHGCAKAGVSAKQLR